MATGNVCRKIGGIWTCDFRDMRTDRQTSRQTDRQTDRHIHADRGPDEGEVTI